MVDLKEITLRLINNESITESEKDYFDHYILNEPTLECFELIYIEHCQKVSPRAFLRMKNRDNLSKLYQYFSQYEIDRSLDKPGKFSHLKEQVIRNEIFDPKYKALFLYFNKAGYHSSQVKTKEIYEELINLHSKYLFKQNDNFKSYIGEWIRTSKFIPPKLDNILIHFLGSDDEYNQIDLLDVLLDRFEVFTKNLSSNTLTDLYNMIDLVKSRYCNKNETSNNHFVVQKKDKLNKMRDNYLTKVSQELRSRNDGIDLNYLLL